MHDSIQNIWASVLPHRYCSWLTPTSKWMGTCLWGWPLAEHRGGLTCCYSNSALLPRAYGKAASRGKTSHCSIGPPGWAWLLASRRQEGSGEASLWSYSFRSLCGSDSWRVRSQPCPGRHCQCVDSLTELLKDWSVLEWVSRCLSSQCGARWDDCLRT